MSSVQFHTVDKGLMRESPAISDAPVKGVPVFVMLPLDTVNADGNLNPNYDMNDSLKRLKSAGVKGVMADVWWGLVEKDGPLKYNWSGYEKLFDMVSKHGLKLQAVMSFHQCGGNVGDTCNIPLPPWVLDEVKRNPDLVYTDKAGTGNKEYISLGCDTEPELKGRTPIQVYADYMRSFKEAFCDKLGKVIVEIQVGMGPCGELRYPSYPQRKDAWSFPGIGEFQCYDKYMMESLKACAQAVGMPNWGYPPRDSGNYNDKPEETGFFRREGTWDTDYGRFFLNWYSEMLLSHGDRILSAAEGVFKGTGAKLSGKVAGIHWHYLTNSHAAELTAGYYNANKTDGYLPIAHMFKNHGVVLNFTCFEMKDEEQQAQERSCSPEQLLKQVAWATKEKGLALAGENALQRFDIAAYLQIIKNSNDNKSHMSAFTYLRMDLKLFHVKNWVIFRCFVWIMSQLGRTLGHGEEYRCQTELEFNAAANLRNEAAALMHA